MRRDGPGDFSPLPTSAQLALAGGQTNVGEVQGGDLGDAGAGVQRQQRDDAVPGSRARPPRGAGTAAWPGARAPSARAGAPGWRLTPRGGPRPRRRYRSRRAGQIRAGGSRLAGGPGWPCLVSGWGRPLPDTPGAGPGTGSRGARGVASPRMFRSPTTIILNARGWTPPPRSRQAIAYRQQPRRVPPPRRSSRAW